MLVNKIRVSEYTFMKTNARSKQDIMTKNRSFFAAANGFSGFRSNFDKVFSPFELKKLYILKGGPGTGKSTLMRRVRDAFLDRCEVTEIYCSSDPESLDGVILCRDGISVGIADGTSPHVIEPSFPGAVEEIINLGDAFDLRALERDRERIIELSLKKKEAYKNAYSALRSAGEIRECINMLFGNIGIYKKAETIAMNITSRFKMSKSVTRSEYCLLSSFSKNGYRGISLDGIEKELVFVDGDGITDHVLLEEIAKKTRANDALVCTYASPLSPTIIDAIESEDTVFVASHGYGHGKNSLLDLSENFTYTSMKNAYDIMLSIAEKAVMKASEHHFALEDIYSKNIDFKKNDEKLNRLLCELGDVFLK